MGRHRQHNDLERSPFLTSGTFFEGPEGYTFGYGKTVGNGVEGWAPGAIFLHTDGGDNARQYLNHGTKTAATWVERLLIVDDEKLTFGTDSDGELGYNNARGYMTAGTPTGMWYRCPADYLHQRSKYSVFWDEFYPAVAGSENQTTERTWTSIDDGATGTNAFSELTIHGMLQVKTAAEDNDYHIMRSPHKSADPGSMQWFEAKLSLTEANGNAANWVIGFSDVTTNGFLQDDGGGPLASYDGCCFYKLDGESTIHFETSRLTTKSEDQTWAFASGETYKLGYYYDGILATPYVNDVAGTTVVLPANGDHGYYFFGVKAGSASAETLVIDHLLNVCRKG